MTCQSGAITPKAGGVLTPEIHMKSLFGLLNLLRQLQCIAARGNCANRHATSSETNQIAM